MSSSHSLNILKTRTISFNTLTQELRDRCLINSCGKLKNYENENGPWAVSA